MYMYFINPITIWVLLSISPETGREERLQNIGKLWYFVSSGTENINSVNQRYMSIVQIKQVLRLTINHCKNGFQKLV